MISNREVIVMLIGGSMIMLLLAVILIRIVLFYQKKKFRLTQQLLEIDKQHAEALMQSRIEIQEETFKNISQEIHDNIGQALTFVKLNLNGISSVQEEHDKEKLNTSITMISKSIRDLRDVAKSINSDYVSQIGLSKAIGHQLNILQKSGSFETQFQEYGSIISLKPQDELILFRVVQELLNNIVKHAEATVINLQITYEAEELKIQVSDNGKGFDMETVNQSKKLSSGLGLSNMRNRVLLIKGQFMVNSIPAEGTTITISVPAA
jgi:signal transduction histidine kinase